MNLPERPKYPERPILRIVDPQWVTFEGKQALYLRDPLGLSGTAVLVPPELSPILSLLDGTRDVAAVQAALALSVGVTLPADRLGMLLQGMDDAMLLENGAYRTAQARMVAEYRDAPHRPMSHAGLVYPAEPDLLAEDLAGYANGDVAALPSTAKVTGIVSPHIDYERGGATYSELWRMCADAVQDVELVIMLGTDHSGGAGRLTLTRQSYATPLGTLPTDLELVDGLAAVIGPEMAFAEELHHINEHSIELALVWMHHYMGGRAVPVLPILCGSFHEFVMKDGDPGEDGGITAAIEYIREATAGRRTLVVAAGDLAHVGPAFGDAEPVDAGGRESLMVRDEESIAAIRESDAARFFALSSAEDDSRKVCGLSCIYVALRLLEGAKGESIGYQQCAADPQGGSLVSIVGAALWEESS
jgi:AmmeMemoRadiSam system protein B